MTEAAYWDLDKVMRAEIDGAIQTFHTHLEIRKFTSENDANAAKMQKHAEFWRLSSHCLLATLFLKLGTVFDERKDSHSITKYLAVVVAHPEFFSREAFTARVAKRMNPSPVPDWVNKVSEPAQSDLKLLEDALKPHAVRYKQIYRPIRSKYFAHSDASPDQDIGALFAKTNKDEIETTLRFLYAMMHALQQLYQDGTKLTFKGDGSQSHSAYENKTQAIRERTRAVLAAL